MDATRLRLKAQNEKIANLISGYAPEIYTKWAIYFGAYTGLRLEQVFALSLDLGNVKVSELITEYKVGIEKVTIDELEQVLATEKEGYTVGIIQLVA